MRALTAQQVQVETLPKYQACVRVKIDRGDGTMVDLTTLLGTDWVQKVQWSEDINDTCGSFTITVNREEYFNSLAPGVTGSQLNNLTGSYVAMIAPGRKIEIDTAVIPLEATVGSSDWIDSFEGYVDTVDAGSSDYQIQIVGRDLGARVADRWTESTIEENAGSNQALETSMASLLTDIYSPGGGGAPTIYTPVSPGWVLATPYLLQPGQGALDQLSQMANQIGWDIRYYWDTSTSAFRLTLQVPQRSSPLVNVTFQPYQITDAQEIQNDLSWVRNVVQVNYGLTTATPGYAGGGYLYPPGTVTVTSAASITKYGRRFCAIGLGASSNVLDSTHATALANAVLADLEDPLYTCEIDLLFRPEVQLFDYYTFAAPTPWWDVSQSLAVQAISHEFDLPGDDGGEAKAFTTLTCWGFPSTSIYNWHQSMTGNGTTPPVKNLAPSAPGTAARGLIRGFGIVLSSPPNQNLSDWYESQLHASLTTGFTPSAATVVQRGKITDLKGF